MWKYLKHVLLAVVAGMAVYMIYAYDSFNRKGLDAWLVGQTDGEHYPDWGKDMEALEIDCNILDKDHILFSRVYLLQSSDSYQLRFRIAYNIPFLRGNLFGDTEWVKLADSYGNDYFGCLTVFPSEIAWLNCINVTLVMDRDTFSAVSGSSLKVSAACTEGGSGDGDSYAGCEVEILVPEMDGGMRAEY